MPPRTVFADSFYWIALLNPQDAWHDEALSWGAEPTHSLQVTTDWVLVEVMNHFCGGGPEWREVATKFVRSVLADSDVEVLSTLNTDFDAAIAFYESRPDKGYSLIDCRSMLAMRGRGITEVLTHDRHFTQEGFAVLFP